MQTTFDTFVTSFPKLTNWTSENIGHKHSRSTADLIESAAGFASNCAGSMAMEPSFGLGWWVVLGAFSAWDSP